MSETIRIILNGMSEQVPANSSIADLIDLFNEHHPELIAELDGRFVHARDYASARVAEGSRVELFNAAFGG